MNTFDAYKSRPTADALQDLLRTHQDAVYNVCWQVLRQDQDAQDAAQQVLLHLVRDLAKISDAEHFRRWLYRASFQVALDVRKMRRRRMTHEQKARPAEAPSEETIELVHEHVAALDDDLRALVAEHYFEQKPLEALAVARGCSTTAVWKKMERAKEKLRESISKAGASAVLPFLEGVLTSLKPVSAPKGLMATTVAIGGIATKIKLIAVAAVAVVGVTAGVAYGVLHPREEEPQASTKTPPKAPTAEKTAARQVPPPPSLAVADSTPAPLPFTDGASFMAAFKKAVEIPEVGARWQEYRRIGIPFADEEFGRAEAQVPVKHGTREYGITAFGSIMKIWIAKDSKRVLDLFCSVPPEAGLSPAEYRKAVLVNFATYAPDAVLAYAKGLPEDQGRAALVEVLAPMSAAGARDAAVRAGRLPEGDHRTRSLEKALADWANSDFRAAAEWAETVLSREEWKSMMGHVLQLTGGRQNSAAAAEVSLKVFQGEQIYNLGVERLVEHWCESDPAAAAAFVFRLPVIDALRENLSVRVARAWGLRDPAAALLWSEQLPEGSERRECLRAIGGAMVKSVKADPVQALGLVNTLPEKERRPAMELIVAAWAEFDPRAAAAVALSYPGGPVGTSAVAKAWASKDVDAARAWAATLPAAEREAAIREIATVRIRK